MKKNIFAETYAQVQELKKRYNAAKDAGDEAGMQTARDAYNLLMDGIGTAGESSVRIYRLYEEAQDCGNKYIDFNEMVWDKDVAGMAAALRENGITHSVQVNMRRHTVTFSASDKGMGAARLLIPKGKYKKRRKQQ